MTDDWRMQHQVESEYRTALGGRPRPDATKLYNRIVNLDIASGYTAIAPVLPGQTGKLPFAFF